MSKAAHAKTPAKVTGTSVADQLVDFTGRSREEVQEALKLHNGNRDRAADYLLQSTRQIETWHSAKDKPAAKPTKKDTRPARGRGDRPANGGRREAPRDRAEAPRRPAGSAEKAVEVVPTTVLAAVSSSAAVGSNWANVARGKAVLAPLPAAAPAVEEPVQEVVDDVQAVEEPAVQPEQQWWPREETAAPVAQAVEPVPEPVAAPEPVPVVAPAVPVRPVVETQAVPTVASVPAARRQPMFSTRVGVRAPPAAATNLRFGPQHPPMHPHPAQGVVYPGYETPDMYPSYPQGGEEEFAENPPQYIRRPRKDLQPRAFAHPGGRRDPRFQQPRYPMSWEHSFFPGYPVEYWHHPGHPMQWPAHGKRYPAENVPVHATAYNQ